MINIKTKKAIIWDWNGTILNDTKYCINCMNILLKKRNIPSIDVDIYRDVFTFPVKEYYKKIGFDFDKEDFSIPAMEFIDLYLKDIHTTSIFDESLDILISLKNKGISQYILSAMEHNSLLHTLSERKIINYFDKVSGLGDHYAKSKSESGKNLLKQLPFHKSEMVMIGDTIHDIEVADELGIECLIVANGHQSRRRIQSKTNNVINSHSELFELINR